MRKLINVQIFDVVNPKRIGCIYFEKCVCYVLGTYLNKWNISQNGESAYILEFL